MIRMRKPARTCILPRRPGTTGGGRPGHVDMHGSDLVRDAHGAVSRLEVSGRIDVARSRLRGRLEGRGRPKAAVSGARATISPCRTGADSGCASVITGSIRLARGEREAD